MNALVLAALLQTAAPAQTVDVTLGGFRAVGLSDEETSRYRARLDEELNAIGVALQEPETAIDVDCYDDLACLGSAPGQTAGLVDVELVRVGPFMQVKFRFWNRETELLLDEDGMEDAEEFAAGGKLVPALFQERVGASGQPIAAGENTVADSSDPTTVTEEFAPAPTEQPAGPEPLPVLGYTGIGVAVLGGVLVLGGGLLALNEMTVLENAQSLGGDKERARVLGPSALVAAGLGAVVLGGGGALATMGFAGQ